MTKRVAGKPFPGVEAGTASGIGKAVHLVGFSPRRSSLRYVDERESPATLIGLKYSHHKPTDRSLGARDITPDRRLTVLISGGPWRQRVWREGAKDDVEYVLTKPGDYIAWDGGLRHQWWPGDATMVTLTFRMTNASIGSPNTPVRRVLRRKRR